MPFPGQPTSPTIGLYTRAAFKNDANPRYSLLSRVAAAGGVVGPDSHDTDADFATRFGLTAAFR